jgi:hypothetical protein
MAYYAFLDENNIVTEVITGRDEWEEVDGITDWEQAYSEVRGQVCKRTSYNHKIRYNYAGIGFTYDPIDDAFIAPMPPCGHDSLLLNELKRWECADCEATFKSLSDPA